ncbi:MAG TPA: hypothetical protein VMG13_10145 [Trebonia sp.]|nr:hypothetical protein [Trebonia sp.]
MARSTAGLSTLPALCAITLMTMASAAQPTTTHRRRAMHQRVSSHVLFRS